MFLFTHSGMSDCWINSTSLTAQSVMQLGVFHSFVPVKCTKWLKMSKYLGLFSPSRAIFPLFETLCNRSLSISLSQLAYPWEESATWRSGEKETKRNAKINAANVLMCFCDTNHSDTPEPGYIWDKCMHVEHFKLPHASPLKQKKFTLKFSDLTIVFFF